MQVLEGWRWDVRNPAMVLDQFHETLCRGVESLHVFLHPKVLDVFTEPLERVLLDAIDLIIVNMKRG